MGKFEEADARLLKNISGSVNLRDVEGRSQLRYSVSSNIVARVVFPTLLTPVSQTIGRFSHACLIRSVQYGLSFIAATPLCI